MQNRKVAGFGGILFTVLLITGAFAASPPGGNYKASEVNTFIAQSGARMVLSVLVVAAAAAALMVVMGYLVETTVTDRGAQRVGWGASLLAAGAMVAGWVIVVTPVTSKDLGGGPSIDPRVAYTIIQAGWGVFLVVTGVMLGISLLVIALEGRRAPAWMRAFSGVVGLLVLLSFLFFPFFLTLLWGLVTGVWLIASSSPEHARTPIPEMAA